MCFGEEARKTKAFGASESFSSQPGSMRRNEAWRQKYFQLMSSDDFDTVSRDITHLSFHRQQLIEHLLWVRSYARCQRCDNSESPQPSQVENVGPEIRLPAREYWYYHFQLRDPRQLT